MVEVYTMDNYGQLTLKLLSPTRTALFNELTGVFYVLLISFPRLCQSVHTEDEIMVSFDVVTLFTSIPVDLALQIVWEKLQQDVTLTERTDISVTNIMRLLELVLKNSFFTDEQEHYQQTFGCAMGYQISVGQLSADSSWTETLYSTIIVHH